MIVSGSNRVAKVETYYFASKLAEIARLNTEGRKIINLGIGSPDLSPPQIVLDTLVEGIHSSDAHKYQSYRGIPELRSAFSKFYFQNFEVLLNSETEVLPLIGSKEGIMHISMAFLNEGDKVLIPDPGYPTYASATKLAGGLPVAYNLKEINDWLPNFDELESEDLSDVKIMWINYPHMPTGKTADITFYKRLVEFALRNNILICHDNPYSFILNDSPLSIFQVENAKKCCLELMSLSKTYNMAGWRVGAVLGSQEYINLIMRFKSNMDSGMYKPVQLAACKALSMKQDWFGFINDIYRRRREKVWEIMDLLDVEYSKDAAGLFVWGKPRSSKDVKQWVDEILYKAEVFITPGFVFGKNGSEYLRIALCTEEKLLDEVISRINAFVNEKMPVS